MEDCWDMRWTAYLNARSISATSRSALTAGGPSWSDGAPPSDCISVSGSSGHDSDEASDEGFFSRLTSTFSRSPDETGRGGEGDCQLGWGLADASITKLVSDKVSGRGGGNESKERQGPESHK